MGNTDLMKMYVNYKNGVINEGNCDRVKAAMRKSLNGGPVKLAFLGGSITQGSLSSRPETCYASLVASWWRSFFGNAEVALINAGIGATTSHFGAARVEDDVLSYGPDIVFIEYSVNDADNDFFKETYEGLVRRVLSSGCSPAVVLIHNAFYETGSTAERIHSEIGKHYGLTCLSMKNTVIATVARGIINSKEISPDGLHPNDAGHELLAKLVTSWLTGVAAEATDEDSATATALPAPLTANAYEHAVRLQNYNCTPKTDGFYADTEQKHGITDIFKCGFIGTKKGDRISFNIEGSEIAIQYRRSVMHPACVARALIDGEKEFILDGNFDETWGDFICLDPVLVHGVNGKHTVDIEITEGDATCVPFYLAGIVKS